MGNALRFERSMIALLLGATTTIFCGGSATENGSGIGGTGAAGSGAASGGAAATAGTPSSGASGAGTASGGASSGGVGGSCEEAKAAYMALVDSLRAQGANTACSVNTDCAYVQTGSCGNGCSVSTANSAAAPAISAKLDAFAAANCTQCAFQNLPCDLLIPAAQCVAGRCAP